MINKFFRIVLYLLCSLSIANATQMNVSSNACNILQAVPSEIQLSEQTKIDLHRLQQKCSTEPMLDDRCIWMCFPPGTNYYDPYILKEVVACAWFSLMVGCIVH